MALNDDLAVFRVTPLFSELPDEALRLIAFGAEHRNILKGDTLYKQGDAASCAYVVASGSIEVWWQSGEREAVSQGVLDQGSLMGEIALISATERQFTAKATENSSLIRINRDLFHRLISEYPQIADKLRVRIEQNLGDLVGKLNQLSDRFR